MKTLVQELPLASAAKNEPVPTRHALLWANVIALLGVALFFRVWHLGNIAGINGDEAWGGLQAIRLLEGHDIEWRTPNGNLINPFLLLPLVVLHAIWSPSIELLRVVPLVSGLLALAANFVLCRRAFDQRTAVVSTLLLALLPIDIAYSRFAWDASESLLAAVFILYLPLIGIRRQGSRWAISAAAIFACTAAILIHPTNVFAVMLVTAPVVYTRRRKIVRTLRRTRIPAKTWTIAALVAGTACLTFLAWQAAPLIAARAHGPADLGTFAVRYLQLFSGSTVYAFISGAGLNVPDAGWFAATTMPFDLAFGALAIVALWGVARRVAHLPDRVDACLVLGWFAMLVGYFIVAGPEALAPHFERYGTCLIAPGALVLARGLTWWIERPRLAGTRFVIALAVAAWLLPTSFYWNYFQCFFQTGGLSHRAFRSAAIEPKVAALGVVLEHKAAGQEVTIVCHEWWTYQPLAYLAARESGVRVLTWDAWRAGQLEMSRAGNTWFVEFADSDGAREVRRATGTIERQVPEYTILDAGERPLISVIGPAENLSQNY